MHNDVKIFNVMSYAKQEKTTKQMRTKVIYLQLAVARGSATVICFLAETQRQAGEWEGFAVE